MQINFSFLQIENQNDMVTGNDFAISEIFCTFAVAIGN